MRRNSCRICTRSCSSSAESGSSSKNARFGDRRARQRHALLLAARQVRRQAIGELGQPHLLHHLIDGLVALRPGLPAHPKRKGDVIAYRQMRKQRVGLEHHRRPPLDRRQPHDVLAADHDFAGGRIFVPCDHAQDRGLAAAGGTEEAAIGAVRDLQIDAVDHIGHAIKALAETGQFDIAFESAHGGFP
jgi:hypothetical protein